MNATEKKADAVQGTATARGTANKATNRPSLTGKEAQAHAHEPATEPAKTQAPAGGAQSKEGKDGGAKAGTTAAMDHQPANAAEATTTGEVKDGNNETGKGEAVNAVNPATDEKGKEAVRYIKPAQNLEQTLKSVDSLHRLTIQRLALISRIKLLEDFEVKLVEDGDELEANPYHGCKLIIKDDRNREFVTNTPNLIRMVAQFLFDACYEKLAEIEGNIVFPNA